MKDTHHIGFTWYLSLCHKASHSKELTCYELTQYLTYRYSYQFLLCWLQDNSLPIPRGRMLVSMTHLYLSLALQASEEMKWPATTYHLLVLKRPLGRPIKTTGLFLPCKWTPRHLGVVQSNTNSGSLKLYFKRDTYKYLYQKVGVEHTLLVPIHARTIYLSFGYTSRPTTGYPLFDIRHPIPGYTWMLL